MVKKSSSRTAAAGGADRLAALFAQHRLTATHRAIAQTIIAHATDAPYLSAEAVADLAGVSQSSVSRFATAAGFRGYPALRSALRHALTGSSDQTAAVEQNRMQKVVNDEIDHLRALANSLADPSAVAAIGKSMAASTPLGILGLRNCMPLAHHVVYLASRVHPDVRLLDVGDSTLIDKLEQLTAAGGTCLLVIALPRHSRDLFAALTLARRMGLTIVSLLDSPFSSVAELSDLSVHAPVGTELIFDIPAAPLVLSMLLVQAMCDAMPASWRTRLERFDALANDERIYTER